MSFQTINKIETADTYLDNAFRRGREKAAQVKSRKKRRAATPGEIKGQELDVIRVVSNSLIKCLDRILTSFPMSDQLTPFYSELLKCSLDFAQFKKSLGAVAWAKRNIERFQTEYSQKVKRSGDASYILSQRRMFYGRISSILKQIKKELLFLESARKTIKKFPVIKEGIKTISLFGFPNVGKTTLLTKLTSSRPEIAVYPFTTKTINLGYIQLGIKKIQLLDTPGTLNRFEKMNEIEKQAYLALKYVADIIIYIFDLSEPYPIADQIKLYNSISEFNKPILIYYSKSDVLDKDTIGEFRKKFEGYTNAEELKAELMKI